MGKKAKKTIKEIKDELKLRYKARKVFGWSGYADDPKEKPLADLIERIAKERNFIPSYLYTIAIGEGLGFNYVDILSNYSPDPADPKEKLLRTDKPINGFQALGVDDFSDDFPRVKKYLPSDYNEGDEFTKKTIRRKEWGKTIVNSAEFKDLESALYGFAAILAHRRDLFLKHAKEFKYVSITEDQQAYWTYIYFQGEGRGRQYLKANLSADYGKAAVSSMKEVKQKSLERLATWRYVQTKKIFSK